jgi:hypothetical protein
MNLIVGVMFFFSANSVVAFFMGIFEGLSHITLPVYIKIASAIMLFLLTYGIFWKEDL